MSREEFDVLCQDVADFYCAEYGESYEAYIDRCVQEPPRLATIAQAVFFVLFQKKNDLVYDALGGVFNMDGSSAHLNYDKFNKLLERTLEKKKSPRYGSFKM